MYSTGATVAIGVVQVQREGNTYDHDGINEVGTFLAYSPSLNQPVPSQTLTPCKSSTISLHLIISDYSNLNKCGSPNFYFMCETRGNCQSCQSTNDSTAINRCKYLRCLLQWNHLAWLKSTVQINQRTSRIYRSMTCMFCPYKSARLPFSKKEKTSKTLFLIWWLEKNITEYKGNNYTTTRHCCSSSFFKSYLNIIKYFA